MRIESLQPHVANGLIRIHSSQHTLFQQLRHWPKADHDDGPDALEMLWSEALEQRQGAGGAFVPVMSTSKTARHGDVDDDDNTGLFRDFKSRFW